MMWIVNRSLVGFSPVRWENFSPGNRVPGRDAEVTERKGLSDLTFPSAGCWHLVALPIAIRDWEIFFRKFSCRRRHGGVPTIGCFLCFLIHLLLVGPKSESIRIPKDQNRRVRNVKNYGGRFNPPFQHRMVEKSTE